MAGIWKHLNKHIMNAITYLIILITFLLAQLVYFLIERRNMRRYIKYVIKRPEIKRDYVMSITWIVIAFVAFALLGLAINYFIWK